MKKKAIPIFLLLSLSCHSISAQDKPRLIDVRKILKETLDIMRNVPPPHALVTPLPSLIPGVPPPGGRQPLAVAQSSPTYYQQAQPQPLTAPPIQQQQISASIQQHQVQPALMSPYQIPQLSNVPTYSQVQNSYVSQPQQPQQQQPIYVPSQVPMIPAVPQNGYVPVIPAMPGMSSISRMFAQPTEKDMERLFQLPADILTKLATDAKYIDPEPDYPSRNAYTSNSNSQSSSNGNTGGGFSGFSFSVADSSTNKKEEFTVTPNVTTLSVVAENKTDSGVQKPYYLYKDGPDGRAVPWVLVIPQPNGAPSEFVPYDQIAEATKMLNILNENKPENVSVPMLPTEAPPEKISEILKAQKQEKEAVQASTTQAPIEKANIRSIGGFVMESEGATTTTEATTQAAQVQEIVLNGKKYKLVMDEPKPVLAESLTVSTTAPTTTFVPPVQLLPASVFARQGVYPSAEDLARMQIAQNDWQLQTPKPSNSALPQTYVFSPNSGFFVPQEQPQQQPPQSPQVSSLTSQQQAYVLANMARSPNLVHTINGKTFVAPPSYATSQFWKPLPVSINQVSDPQSALPSVKPVSQNTEVFQQAPIQDPVVSQSQNAFLEEAYEQPQQVPANLKPPQSAPQFIQSDAIISTTNAPIPTTTTQDSLLVTAKRRYTLEELEEYFRFKNMDLHDIAGFLKEPKNPSKVETSTKRNFSTYKQINIEMAKERKTTPAQFVEDRYDIENYTTKKPKKYRDIRRKDHRKHSHSSEEYEKVHSEAVTVVKMKKPEKKQKLKITAQHCRNIRSFARQFGTLDIESFAKSHCLYIENYYPDLKCSNVKESCYQMSNQYANLSDPKNPFSDRLDEYGFPIDPPNIISTDITMGSVHSLYPIAAINDVDDEKLPSTYYYVAQNVDPDFEYTEEEMTGCNCEPGQCKVGSCACIDNSQIKLYPDGRVRQAPKIDGHFYDWAVHECSQICKCGGKCKQRMTPEVFSLRVQVFKTHKSGFGCRSLQYIQRGTFVCEYTGELLEKEEMHGRTLEYPYMIYSMGKHENEEVAYYVDPTFCGNISRFFNHSCSENLVPIRFFSSHRCYQRPRIGFVAVKDIFPYDEFTINYGVTWWKDKIENNEDMYCYCNEPNCMWPPPGTSEKPLNEKIRIMNQKAIVRAKAALERKLGRAVDGEKEFGTLWSDTFYPKAVYSRSDKHTDGKD